MHGLSLSDALTIAAATMEAGRRSGFQPLTVAVLDAGGHLLAFQREETAGILRPQIATAKAWGVLGMGFGGRALAKRAEMQPEFFQAAYAVSEGRIVPVSGGVLIRNAEGDIVGSVGVSGDTSVNDESCAVAGIEAAGLRPDAG